MENPLETGQLQVRRRSTADQMHLSMHFEWSQKCQTDWINTGPKFNGTGWIDCLFLTATLSSNQTAVNWWICTNISNWALNIGLVQFDQKRSKQWSSQVYKLCRFHNRSGGILSEDIFPLYKYTSSHLRGTTRESWISISVAQCHAIPRP